MPRDTAKRRSKARVTRYTYDDLKEARTPETGHTSLLPVEEQGIELTMDNGWSTALSVGKLANHDQPVVIDIDPAVDPTLFWAGKRNRRNIALLPLQRNEIVSGSRIGQIVERAREAAAAKEPRQNWLFADLERAVRERDKAHRVEFYKHEEGWKNKLICGDSLEVAQSLLEYEGLTGKIQMVYVDPPYGIAYDSNFQQRVDATSNDDRDQADDVLTVKAFRDTWTLGIHSYLSYLQERLYLCRELLAESGSIFVQINDRNVHLVRAITEEVFGAGNFVSLIAFAKTPVSDSDSLPTTHDYLVWYAKNRAQMKYHKLWRSREERTEGGTYTWIEFADGTSRRLTAEEKSGQAGLPSDSKRFRAADISSQGETASGSEQVRFKGRLYGPSPGRHWRKETVDRLVKLNRVVAQGDRLAYKRFETDFPLMPYTHIWDDTILGTFSTKWYVVQTNDKVIERCMLMTTDPADLVFDPTCGSGTTASTAERHGRRWITCDTSRVAINVTRQRLLSSVFDHYKTRNANLGSGFQYETAPRITMRSLAYDLEPETVELLDRPIVDVSAVRVVGPFECMSIGRYSIEDWKGYLVSAAGGGYGEAGKLQNYIDVICKLYRKDAGVQGATGLLHAVADTGKDRIGISVGPLSGRVTAKQINDVVQDALASGILEVHVLGWSFEANVGEVKSKLESRGKVKIELIMIRPDTLAEGLKMAKPESLFSPLALPDIQMKITKREKGSSAEVTVSLDGVAVFDRKQRRTEYKRADSGYVSAWYLDEDYDGDCFVDCQMFFQFKKAPDLNAEVDSQEFRFQTTSRPFGVRQYKRIAVKVVDVYGNESTMVRDVR